MAHLITHICQIADSLCNLGPQQLPEALAQPMHRDFHRALGHPELCSGLTPRRFIAYKAVLERLEHRIELRILFRERHAWRRGRRAGDPGLVSSPFRVLIDEVMKLSGL